jgi:predicted DCC family thiol-disulfide oxidoreductase YuxK
MTTNLPANNPIILFDGLCNLCSSSVQFIIRNDPANRFRFASLQSGFGQQILKKFNLSPTVLNSLILFQNDTVFTRSTAALKVAKQLSGGWKILSAFLLLPTFIRDAVYDLVSRHRYNWFGKKTSCWLPSESLKSRFIS